MEGKAMILLESTPLAAAIARMLFTPSELKSISTNTASLADFSAKIQALNVPESTLAGRENAASTCRHIGEGMQEGCARRGQQTVEEDDML